VVGEPDTGERFFSGATSRRLRLRTGAASQTGRSPDSRRRSWRPAPAPLASPPSASGPTL